MVKRLVTSPHDPLGITDSACKNQLVVVSVQYGPFNPYIPIRSTTIGPNQTLEEIRPAVTTSPETRRSSRPAGGRRHNEKLVRRKGARTAATRAALHARACAIDTRRRPAIDAQNSSLPLGQCAFSHASTLATAGQVAQPPAQDNWPLRAAAHKIASPSLRPANNLRATASSDRATCAAPSRDQRASVRVHARGKMGRGVAAHGGGRLFGKFLIQSEISRFRYNSGNTH
ncbi:hypothetical protein F511_38696 [Dorcoceras hygrometricum]|uniref:Uncharacterized protein n=1 Tax=Dorcoceras hygrometricum TaxID=472368 RepID=A0A2Z7CPF3_9LAMI|nr:hypothetical protein F511_38696 [Dorcoceras hygrometricum]